MIKNNIKKLRLQQNISQEKLARKIECSVKTIQNLEKQECENDYLKLIFKLKEILNVSNIEDIFYKE